MCRRSPDQQLPLASPMHNGTVVAVRLNGDARDDLFVFLERGKEFSSGMLLLSTP